MNQVIASTTLCIFILVAVVIGQAIEIRHLHHKISCLKHPHGESSMAGVFKNGKFVVTQPPHATGCTG